MGVFRAHCHAYRVIGVVVTARVSFKVNNLTYNNAPITFRETENLFLLYSTNVYLFVKLDFIQILFVILLSFCKIFHYNINIIYYRDFSHYTN